MEMRQTVANPTVWKWDKL